MKIIDEIDLKNLNTEYVWYACYGSNINLERFMKYINGGEYASKEGCNDKSIPLESKKYIINHPIYFAGESKLWTGGMAFLDCMSDGLCYGKIYKIKLNQFIDIRNQEPPIYDSIFLLDYVDDLPVLTFTAKNKLNDILNNPSTRYKEIIKSGLKDLEYDLTEEEMEKYLSN